MELIQVVWNALNQMRFNFYGVDVSLLEFALFSVIFLIFIRFVMYIWK